MRVRAVVILVTLALIAFVFVWWQATRGGSPARDLAPSQDAVGTEAPGLAGAPKRPAPAITPGSTAPEADGTNAPAPHESGTDVQASLRVDIVDAETGLPVGASWALGGIVAGSTVDLPEEHFLASGEIKADVVPDGRSELHLTLRLPAGYVSDDPQNHFPVLLSDGVRVNLASGVRATYAVVPAYREAMLDLRILDPLGRPADTARVLILEVAGTLRRVLDEDRGPGLIRLRGIPFLPGEPVSVGIDWGHPEEVEAVDQVLQPSEGISDPEVSTRVPSDLAGPWVEVVRLLGPTKLRLPDHNEVDRDIPDSGPAVLWDEDGGVGTVRAHAVGWDGSTARDARINDRAVDAKGEVTFQRAPISGAVFTLRAPGRLPTTLEASARAGVTTDVVVQEPVGARLDVTVTDEAGRPRPFARIWMSSLVLDVVDGVQRLDMLTDARGFRSFARVEPGPVHVKAAWGSRRGTVDTTLRDGEPTTLVIVAK